jgi:uncharacterized protein YciI
MKTFLATFLAVFCLCGIVLAQETQKKEKQFIYVLKLAPRLLDEKNWTDQDVQIIGRHFRRLQQLRKEGKVILAGKTLDDSDSAQFGVVIFRADSEGQARKIMEEDDAVKEKIMTAQLFPFRVALIQGND